MKTFTLNAQLAPLVEQMSRDMAVPAEGLVNQAIFNWARLHGYLAPSPTGVAAAVPPPRAPEPAEPPEPETTRVPVVEEPEWKIAAAGTFSAPELPDITSPSVRKLRRVVLVLDEREVVVDGDRFIVGRDVTCNLTIDSPRLSRQHAVIHLGAEVVELEDLKSSNGTWYEGERIARRELQNGDEIFFGDVGVRVEFR